ncbi:MAG: NADH-quinone oxidoreductase subunit NuoK [Gemmataceae bacterium]|nr:NADH-quinone oxidoreductase subunit NuoK [Gemmataceae bacterium]
MTPVYLEHYLLVGAALFALGMIGFLARRNLIIMFLSAEMMLQGVAVNLVAFSRYRGNLGGQALTLFILTVAACEAAVALALILMLYRRRKSLDVSLWQELREPDQEPIVDEEPLPKRPEEEPSPRLTPAGRTPSPPTAVPQGARGDHTQEQETSHV